METVQAGDNENVNLVNSVENMLEDIPPLPTEPCIFRVSPALRWVHEEAYTPWMISIGPLHHGKEHLQAMEVKKQRHLRDFLKRTPDINLKAYFNTLRGLEERVRNCYAERINLSSDELVKMMLLDGCFLVEFFRNLKDRPNDGVSVELVYDIFMIENQLPFFVLEDLVRLNVQQNFHQANGFQDMIQRKLADLNFLPGYRYDLLGRSSYQVKHFVDLLLQAYTPSKARMSSNIDITSATIPSATKLHQAGVKFVNSSTYYSAPPPPQPYSGYVAQSAANFVERRTRYIGVDGATVKFKNGVMEISTLNIHDGTVFFFRNLIAYEQHVNGNAKYVSDYARLMDYLIDTADDVALLRKCGIINNMLGSDEEVSQLFNKLTTYVPLDKDFYFSRLCEDVNAYYNSRWPSWKAKLKRDYFHSPWAFIAFFAAVMLLVMTFLQTLSAVSSWKL